MMLRMHRIQQNTQNTQNIMSDQYKTTSLDIWMLGCVLYFVLTGMSIFYSHDHVVHLEKIIDMITQNTTFKMIKKTDHHIIKKMLSINSYKRINMEQLKTYYNIKCNYESFIVLNYEYQNMKHTIDFDLQPFIKTIAEYYSVNKLNLNKESIILAIKNFSILNDKTKCNNKNMLSLINCFWLSNKITDKCDDNINSLIHILNYFNIKKTKQYVKDYVINICQKLNWDMDPGTSYDYIEMINNNDRNKYVSILLLRRAWG